MAMVRKKQDDKYLEALRELITTGGGNRQCFDCGQKGPTYVNMTIGSFVCTRCSGVLRGITPPHRVKSISMATFTQDEIDYLKAHGNDVCAKTWLGLWDPKRAVHQDQRELMIDKYERKRYYLEPASPLKSLTNATNLKTTTAAGAATSSTSTSSSSVSATATSVNKSQNNNSKTQIQLTPPTSQRTTANGLHKTSSTAISRPQHTTPQPQNGFSSSLTSYNTDAFGLHNGLNSSVGSMSTGALSDTSSCASANGFGAEADFVADFGSADIFNATVASSPASSIGSSKTNNGYAKIQPMKISAAAHQQFMNGHGGGGGGGGGVNVTNIQNGNLVNGNNGNTENFADFDHAPIYNAAVEETPNYQFVRKNAIRKKSTSSISGSIIRRNERQLKDILEMDNNEYSRDYINFNEDDVFGETKSSTRINIGQTGGYSNLFDDFDALLTMDDSGKHAAYKKIESDYANVDVNVNGDHMVNGSKFTPLALAAHATAMAVLGNQSYFNNSQLQKTAETTTSKPFTNQWDVWPSSKEMPSQKSATSWFASNNFTQHPSEVTRQQQQQKQLQQQHTYASIANCNSQRQHPHPRQYFPSSTLSSQTLTQSSALKSFDTGKTAASSVATSTSITPTTKIPTATTTTTTTSMLNKNTINTTNPFRMHLDVNDNFNTINYDNDYFFNNYNTTNITPTTTTTATTTTTTTATTTGNTDFNINFNDFNFVSNSILSYNFDLFSTATTSFISSFPSSASYITTTTTTATPLPTQTYYTINDNNNNYNCHENFKINYNDHDDHDEDGDDIVKDYQNTKNPFLTSRKNSKTHNDLPNSHQFSNYQSPYSSISTSNSAATSFKTSIPTSQNNPFNSAPSDQTIRTFCHTVAVDDIVNIQDTCQNNRNNNNSNYFYDSNYSSNNDNNIDAGSKDVANNFCPSTNHNYFNTNLNSNCNYNSYSYCNTNTNPNATATATATANQNPNSCQNENYNNNSWRLPHNNHNNNRKNSTTNGFNNNNNNNNMNNIINNNNSSTPAEDRYAALKDLDEQLRESKAVAAQAASIVTANVVDSGFGNPNVNNGTVNPFATHNHHQPAVVNPFQNSSNNSTQNATQQLFGQMTLIPNGIAAANGFLNGQKTNAINTGFFNYTASGFTNANTPQIQQQHQQHQASLLYPTSVQTGPNGCGFGFGTLQQQIASTGTGLTTNTFNNPFAATGALNSNNPFL